MSDFTQRTQSYPDARLFEIVRDAEKYAPEAVAAAEVEIERRGLNSADFPAKPKPFAKVSKMMAGLAPPKVQNRPDDVIDWIEQPQQENEAGAKYLLYLVFIIGLAGLIAIYDQWEYLQFALGPNGNGFDVVAVVIILAVLFQFFLAYLLWRRNRTGYYITACFAAIGLTGTLFLAPQLFQDHTDHGGLVDLIESFYPSIDPITFFINLGLSLAAVWLVTRKDLMNLFDVAKKSLTIAIAIGVAYSLLSNLLFTM